MADKLDILISLAAGIGATLYGFGVIGKKPGGAADPRSQQFRALAKWIGLFLVVISAVRLVLAR